MDLKTIQKAFEAVQRALKPIVEAITRLWKTFKTWVSECPHIVKLFRREQTRNCNRAGVRSLFQAQPKMKVYHSQVSSRHVRQVARSSC